MNLTLFTFLYSLAHQNSLFDGVVIFFADTADKITLVAAGVYLIYFFITHQDWKGKRWIAWVQESAIIGISIFIAWGVSFVIKTITHVARPFIADPTINPLIIHGGYDSFPSGHATVFFGLAGALYLYDKKIGWVFGVIAGIIAIARVIAGVHYPVDILAGAVIGVLIAIITHRALSRLK